MQQGRRCKAATALATVSGDNPPQVLATARKRGKVWKVGDLIQVIAASQEICSLITLRLVLRRAGEAKNEKKTD